MQGIVRFTARIWQLGDETRTPIDTWQETVDASMLQTLSLRGVFVTYSGPDPTKNATNPPTVNLPAPTLANLQATAAWTLTTNPLESQGVFSSAGQMNWFAPLTGTATSRAAARRTGSRSPTGSRSSRTTTAIAATSSTTGCCPRRRRSRTSRVRAVRRQRRNGHGPADDGHEIGHGAGLKHGPVRRDGDHRRRELSGVRAVRPRRTRRRPRSENTASTSPTARIHPPTDKDYMSYCGPGVDLALRPRPALATTLPSTRGVSASRLGGRRTSSIPTCGRGSTCPIRPTGTRHPGDLRVQAERPDLHPRGRRRDAVPSRCGASPACRRCGGRATPRHPVRRAARSAREDEPWPPRP